MQPQVSVSSSCACCSLQSARRIVHPPRIADRRDPPHADDQPKADHQEPCRSPCERALVDTLRYALGASRGKKAPTAKKSAKAKSAVSPRGIDELTVTDQVITSLDKVEMSVEAETLLNEATGKSPRSSTQTTNSRRDSTRFDEIRHGPRGSANGWSERSRSRQLCMSCACAFVCVAYAS